MEPKTAPLQVLFYDANATPGRPDYAKSEHFAEKTRECLRTLNRPFELDIQTNARRVEWLISQATTVPWDLMILDIVNPNLEAQLRTDGFCGIALALRARQKWSHTKVVFFTHLDYMHDVNNGGTLNWAGWVQKHHPNTFTRLYLEITSRLAPPAKDFVLGRFTLHQDNVTISWRGHDVQKKGLTPASYSILHTLLTHTRQKAPSDYVGVSLAEIASVERLKKGAIHTRIHVLLGQLSDLEQRLVGQRLPKDSVIVNKRGFYKVVEK